MTAPRKAKAVIFVMIKKYVENIINNFPEKLKSTDIAKTLAGNSLFNQGQGGKLQIEHAGAFYSTVVAKGLFQCTKLGRPDIQPTIAVLLQTRAKMTGLNSSDR